MKTKIILSVLVMLMAVSSSYASFPVTRTTSSNAAGTTMTVGSENDTVLTSPAASAESDTFIIALLLWIFLGGLAGHRWYLGSPVGWNILFILTLGGLGIWWIVDGIDILTKKYPGL